MTPTHAPVAYTYALAAGHFAIAILDQMRRSAFHFPPTGDALSIAGDHDAWPVLHLLVAIALIAAVAAGRGERLACRASFAVYFAWGVIAFVWTVLAPVQLSLVGPVLVGVVCLPVAYKCSGDWTLINRERARAARRSTVAGG